MFDLMARRLPFSSDSSSTVIVEMNGWLALMEGPRNVSPHDRHFFTSRSFPVGTGVQILDTTTTKTLHVCAPPSHLFFWKYIHDMGAFLQAQLGGGDWDCAAAADCICIVQPVSSFSCSTGRVWQIRRTSQHHQNQRLSAEQISPFVLFNSNQIQRITRNVCLTTAFTMHCSGAQSLPNKDR